jgi:hypothetical protein
MLKNFARDFSSGFTKFFTTERVLILVVFLVLAYALYAYSGAKTLRVDNFSSGTDAVPAVTTPVVTQKAVNAAGVSTGGAAGVTVAGSAAASPAPQISGGYTAQSVTAPQDLLPVDQNSQWATLNPVAQGNIAAPDLLQAGYHIGLDTIGQTLRNANLQERSDPIIPKSNIGPWNQSTIEPDLGRVPLEVGAGAR